MGMFNKAKNNARKASELLYEHMCSIKEYKKVKDPVTKVTETKLVSVLENQPCRISFQSIKSANQTSSNSELQQSIKLFIAPEVIIKEGSVIVANYNGREGTFKNSGIPAVYSTHQEILLEIAESA